MSENETRIQIPVSQCIIIFMLGVILTGVIIIGIILFQMTTRETESMKIMKHFYGIDKETNVIDVTKNKKKRRK